MENNIRSEYIKNLVEDKDKLTQKLEETTKNTLQNVVEETINKQLRQMISEANDDYDVEEVNTDTDDVATDDAETPADVDVTATDATAEDGEGGEDVDVTADVEAGAEGGDEEAAGDDVWGGLEQFKGEDGEYDLTSMGKDDVIKVLKVMGPEDGVRVLKNDNGTVTLQDDETDKEYIIDMDGSIGSGDETDSADEENEFEIEIDDDATDECGVKEGDVVTEGEVDLGYTDSYQKETAMTVDNNNEPADKKNTYSMDAGVPTGTEKPWVGHKGNMSPYGSKEKKVNEGEACGKCGKNPCECKNLDETQTSTENSANVRGTGMTHANTNSHQKFARNGHVKSVETRGTGEGYEPATNESIVKIKKQANAIFKENKELRQIAESIKNKLEEAIVVNSSLGSIIKLITENATSIEEKKNIIKRFDSVKTITESKALFNTISEELKKTNKVNNTSENTLDNQLTESKKTKLVETTMYQSADLSATISLMERLNKI